MVVVDERERADAYVLVEGECNLTAEIVLVGVVDQAIPVAICQVLSEDSDVPDVYR